MGSVATFMIVLIMKLMPQIKLCVLYKYGNITYYIKHDDRNGMHMKWTIIIDGHFKRTIVDLSVSLRKFLYDSLFPSLCVH